VSDVPLEMQHSRKRSVSTSMVQIEEGSFTSRVVEEDYDFHVRPLAAARRQRPPRTPPTRCFPAGRSAR
jgi:hypothetical protein